MWFLEQNIIDEIRVAIDAGQMPTAEQETEYAARASQMNMEGSRILRSKGDTAEIAITGTLTKSPSLFMSMFGGGNTSYPEIIEALNQAQADEQVKKIDLLIDSPGGQLPGMFEAIAAVQAVSLPTKAIVSNLAASAAYAIASQTDEIVVTNKATRIGSIGIAASFFVFDNDVEIVSTLAPKKRPDVTTEEGRKVVREELDALHDLFVEAISDGRNVSAATINKKYGQGAVLLADEALRRGMIDKIQKPEPLRSINQQKQEEEEERAMDLKQLKTEYPAIYDAAVDDGVAQERDRVAGHLIAGKNSGAMDVAVKAIEGGDMMTQALAATYLTIARNGSDLDARGEDDKALAQVADNAPLEDDKNAESDQVADMVCEKMGVQGVSNV